MLMRSIPDDKYELAVQHIKQIVQPMGAWNNDMEIYLTNVVKSCIEHAEAALDLLEEEYQSLKSTEEVSDI